MQGQQLEGWGREELGCKGVYRDPKPGRKPSRPQRGWNAGSLFKGVLIGGEGDKWSGRGGGRQRPREEERLDTAEREKLRAQMLAGILALPHLSNG